MRCLQPDSSLSEIGTHIRKQSQRHRGLTSRASETSLRDRGTIFLPSSYWSQEPKAFLQAYTLASTRQHLKSDFRVCKHEKQVRASLLLFT